jgi:apolipoprotein N-acyltransferase
VGLLSWRTPLSALLFVLAFPPWDFRHLIWFSLVPWFFAMDRARSTRQAFAQGLLLSFLVSLMGFYWVGYVLKQFGGLPWPLAILGLFLFGLLGICQPQFLAFPILYRLIGKLRAEGTLPGTLAFTSLMTGTYVAIDWLFPKLFVDTIGHSQYTAEWLRQSSDLGGPFLISFLVIFVNFTIYLAIRAVRTREEPSYWPALQGVRGPIIASVLLLVSASVYGKIRFEDAQARIAAAPRTVHGAMIQANIGDFEKVAAERGVRNAANTIIQKHLSMSEQALKLTPKPEFLVWPETSYPSTFRNPMTNDELSRDQRVEQFVRNVQTPLLFGGYDTFEGKDFNAFFLLTPTPRGIGFNSDLQTYRKNILLLFGEYIPGSKQFKFLRDAFPQVGNFGRGAGPEIQHIPTASGDLAVGPVICYEVLFPNYVVEATRKGSQMILNITNDSWFGPWGEPQLHLALTTFRAIENRIPIFRATNTGISAVILPDGTISQATSLFTEEILNARIPIIEPMPTLFKWLGDWFGFACFLLSAIAVGGLLYRKRLPAGAP